MSDLPAAKAVFFDFGGVFIASPFGAIAPAAERLGIGEAAMTDAIFGPYDADTDHPWHRLERGELSFEEARAAIGDLSESRGLIRLDPMVALADLAVDRSVREFMVDAVRDLRGRGILTGVITNNIAEFGAHWKSMIPVDELFDDIVDSSAVGIRKPDAAIYALACERLTIDPADAVFIDDFQGNVDGAVAAGMRAVCCGYTTESTRAALVELLALVG